MKSSSEISVAFVGGNINRISSGAHFKTPVVGSIPSGCCKNWIERSGRELT